MYVCVIANNSLNCVGTSNTTFCIKMNVIFVSTTIYYFYHVLLDWCNALIAPSVELWQGLALICNNYSQSLSFIVFAPSTSSKAVEILSQWMSTLLLMSTMLMYTYAQ